MKRTPLPRCTRPIKRSAKPLKRTRIKKRRTPKADLVYKACQRALDWYFRTDSTMPCQISGLTLSREDADPAHLSRRWKGMHEFCHILAADRKAHTWMDARPEREAFARASKVSCQTGGVIQWPAEMKASLNRWIVFGFDPIELKAPSEDAAA